MPPRRGTGYWIDTARSMVEGDCIEVKNKKEVSSFRSACSQIGVRVISRKTSDAYLCWHGGELQERFIDPRLVQAIKERKKHE